MATFDGIDGTQEPAAAGLAHRVGARELKARLSSYLQRAASGEAFVVTDYGKPIARLVPLQASPYLEELLASGRATWSGRAVRLPVRPVRPRGGKLVG